MLEIQEADCHWALLVTENKFLYFMLTPYCCYHSTVMIIFWPQTTKPTSDHTFTQQTQLLEESVVIYSYGQVMRHIFRVSLVKLTTVKRYETSTLRINVCSK